MAMNINESGNRPIQPLQDKELLEIPKIKLQELSPEKREQLEKLVESDSLDFFKMMQQKIDDVKADLMSAYSEQSKSLNLATVENMLTAEGIAEYDAKEAAVTIVAAAKHADSAEQFATFLDKNFDPNRRLPLTLSHFRERSRQSWYLATPQGQERLQQLLGQLE